MSRRLCNGRVAGVSVTSSDKKAKVYRQMDFLFNLVILLSFILLSATRTRSFAVCGALARRRNLETFAVASTGDFAKRRHFTMPASEGAPAVLQFVDIGANLLDERFQQGKYHGKNRHEPDWDQIMERAANVGVSHIILTAGTLQESRRAIELVRQLRHAPSATKIQFGCTVGVHPTRCTQEFVDNVRQDRSGKGKRNGSDPPIESADDVLDQMVVLIRDGQSDGTVVAVGEIGLDYDRLEFSSREDQLIYFRKQLQSFAPHAKNLPLFLHNRNVGTDLLDILQQEGENLLPNGQYWTGVVHSYDDTLELAQMFIDRGLYIGINGCSLKTKENLEVVKELPLDRILLETDCPYCEVKATHAGFGLVKTTFPKKLEKKFEMGQMVKGRNEPCQIVHVAEIIAGVKGLTVQEVADQCYKNSQALYSQWMSAPAPVL